MTDGVEILKAGWPIAVMVEGRIVPPDQRAEDGMGEFRDGFIAIARNADADIVPITLHNADGVWPSGSWPRLPFRGRPKVTVKVGTPFATDGLVDAEVMAEARGQMAEMLATS
jgi:1-acyl-sn-glycerol-3-phosphate acyltransferase